MRLSIPKSISSRPWLIVVFGFAAFVAWWIFFIWFAVRHQPQMIPLDQPPAAQSDTLRPQPDA